MRFKVDTGQAVKKKILIEFGNLADMMKELDDFAMEGGTLMVA